MLGKIKQTIKEFFTARYDPEKNKIYNATPNTLIYFHEEGHKTQYENGMLSKWFMYQRWIIYVVLLQLLFEHDLQILILIVLYPEYHVEIDAWIYAIKKKRRIKKGGFDG